MLHARAFDNLLWRRRATGSLERRWRPLPSVAASAAFARPSFDLRSVCGPEFTEPGFADGRFRIQGTEESSLSCTAGDHISRGFNPLKLEILLSWESARLSPTKRTSRSSSSSICRSSHLRTTTRSIRVRIAPLFAHVVLLLFLHFFSHQPRPDHAAALLPNPDHRNQGSLGTYRNSASLRGRLSGEAGLDQDDAASMACGWLRCVFLVDRGAGRGAF